MFFNDTATTEIYTLSLHDALPIWHLLGRGDRDDAGDVAVAQRRVDDPGLPRDRARGGDVGERDRKSTRLNSSNATISYAGFCLSKKAHCAPPPTRRWSARSVARPR